ncbi:MAG: hypothetical protein ACLTMP_08655 [Eggerthella lenta]
MYEPPFDPTDKITATALDIAEMVGRLAPDSALSSSPVLHRELRIKTIHSSLAIEQNTLTMEQVTDIIDGRRVFGRPTISGRSGMPNEHTTCSATGIRATWTTSSRPTAS